MKHTCTNKRNLVAAACVLAALVALGWSRRRKRAARSVCTSTRDDEPMSPAAFLADVEVAVTDRTPDPDATH
jgi:hypothetical protein